MNHDKAIQLIRDLVVAEVQLMKKMDSRQGETKKAAAREAKAAAALFKALTGETATEIDVRDMTLF